MDRDIKADRVMVQSVGECEKESVYGGFTLRLREVLEIAQHYITAFEQEHTARVKMERALERDQTGLVEALMAVVKAVKARHWILEGRGSYTYNDDQYRKEAGWAFDKIEGLATKALRESGKLAFEVLAQEGKRDE